MTVEILEEMNEQKGKSQMSNSFEGNMYIYMEKSSKSNKCTMSKNRKLYTWNKKNSLLLLFLLNRPTAPSHRNMHFVLNSKMRQPNVYEFLVAYCIARIYPTKKGRKGTKYNEWKCARVWVFFFCLRAFISKRIIISESKTHHSRNECERNRNKREFLEKWKFEYCVLACAHSTIRFPKLSTHKQQHRTNLSLFS